ncbi:AraC family transcriptional regulator [Leptospira langatensis]|uniref:AraC family transcriptional regulator n=1 Tax=Leptospira langatensis TaxID=2484983 RepID=A0A5F1ZZ78_9LEPT|nr:AraC family transcriptional regulator [Leptospira langatensis]TGJ98393.1 AraC family transcriptional regulator [Leptospira langatensis]TGL43307.1 AraC family transcriptional regulator [Leptospira langatensis]
MDLDPKGIVYLWTTRVLFATNRMQTEFHEHYAASLAIALNSPIHIETETSKDDYSVALVGPNTYHRTLSPGKEMVVLLIDPETYEYGSISDFGKPGEVRKLDPSPFLPLMERLWDLYYGNINDSDAWELQLDMLRCVFPFRKKERNIDDRIRKIAHKIRTELPDSIRMREIGKDFSISEDRLIRLFKENLGIPLRRYLLWVRILAASRFLMEGMNITEAAHSAGFSDSAHFTRTFKENFGFVPSFFFGHLKSIEVRFCESGEYVF